MDARRSDRHRQDGARFQSGLSRAAEDFRSPAPRRLAGHGPRRLSSRGQLRTPRRFRPAEAERNDLVEGLRERRETRATVLRQVADNAEFKQKEKNRAFVLMQYFGYLHRNPNEGPDADMSGYNFWLRKLDDNGGDFIRAEMVRAFIESTEYRDRFDW